MALHQDFKDLLAAFAERGVRYLVVGGYAVAFHGQPRYTKDIDLWIDADPSNVEAVAAALEQFGAPRMVIEAVRSSAPDEVVYMGAPPVRVDLLKGIPGLEFASAFANRASAEWDGIRVSVLSLDDLIAAKTASGRPQDHLDVTLLRRVRDRQ